MTASRPDAARPPILVTGAHRSGSTWIGRMLAAADELHYVQEPFNIVAHQRWLSPRPSEQFLYVCEANEGPWVAPVRRVVELRYPLVAHLRHRTPLSVRRTVRVAVDAAAARRQGRAALVKDPIAVFSSAWLVDRFGAKAVVIVRDATAFVGSLKERNWTFDFAHWLRQPLLMEHVLSEHRAEIEQMAREPGDVIAQGILQWNAIYGFVAELRRTRPDITVVRYEEVAADPHVEVEGLYCRLGLTYGSAQRAVVERLSTGTSTARSPIDVQRSSREALAAGSRRLTEDEAERVRGETATVAAWLRESQPNVGE